MLNNRVFMLAMVALLVALARPALAGGKAVAPVVPGFERFHAKTPNDVAGGRLLLGELNCISCHRPDAALESHIFARQAPILDGVGQRVQRSYLQKFLSDPQAVKPGTLMPNLFAGMPEQEREAKVEALVHFLASPNPLPQEKFDRKSVAPGKNLFNKVGCVACHGPRDDAGIQTKTWPGLVPLGDLPAKYSLASLRVFLENPLHTRPSARMPGLLDAKEAKHVAHYLMQQSAEANLKKATPDFAIQPKLAEQGKELFATMGCASCHQLHVQKRPLESQLTAASLEKLRSLSMLQAGCLDKKPGKGVPHYPLSPAQETALTAAIKALPPVIDAGFGPREKEKVARTLTTFNCYACHQRDSIGGVEELASPYFHTSDADLADEGRLPPSLTGVGAKLQPAYFKTVLDKGAHDRPYMQTRMPRFGDANVGHLVTLLPQIDKIAVVPDVTFKQTMVKVKAEGRHLVGSQAFGCIKCHTFAGKKAEGIQGVDMTIMTTRVKREWFHRYLLNPSGFRPLTRMPTAWPGGFSTLPRVLEGDPAKQIEAIWDFLADGTRAALPIGVINDKNLIMLTPDKEAIIYRNFLQGAGPRAIGVGYPEKAHLAFDANDIRLAMLWQGAFLNAGRHWTGRGEGFEPPLGDNILHLPAGVSFAVLAKETDPWPTKPARELGNYKFLGYRLSADQRPTFMYSVGDVNVDDFPNPLLGKAGVSMVRTLEFTGDKQANLYFRAMAADKIEAQKDGWYRIGGEKGWRMRIEAAAAPQIRAVGKSMELLVPVTFKDGKARILQEFAW